MDVPREKIGPYRLTRHIGSGGIGSVFAAVHEHMHQEVALKVLSPESASDPQLVARFLQESRALTSVQHRSVVRALYSDKLPDGTAFLAMEYLEGVTLRRWLKERREPLPREAALFIAREIADAMVEVHRRGIVHRDLKPENVMLVADPVSPIGYGVKLLDFGIAKVPPVPGEDPVNTHVQTGTPSVLGTAMYMAPEQCRNGADVTDRADVYSLGVVLFELLAGRPPFEASEPVELMSMHLRMSPPHLEELAPHVTSSLAAFVSSMLDKMPSSRPAMTRCRDVLTRSEQGDARTCPFPGLLPFTESHAELFFGRQDEQEVLASLLEKFERGDLRWLQIEGPGGSGKTSLVQAAILPGFVHRSADAPAWGIAMLRPTTDPISTLAKALSSIGEARREGEIRSDLEDALRAGGDALAQIIGSTIPSGSRLLLVIDPLDELLMLDPRDIALFDAVVCNALMAQDSPLRLLTTLRSDHAHRLGLLRCLTGVQGRSQHHLKPLQENGLLEVIEGMTSRAGVRFSEGLAERLARDAAATDSRLPLLGHMLHSLWSPRRDLIVTHEHYERLGGIAGALVHQANAVLEEVGEERRERALWLLLDLVHVGRGAPDTRRSRTRAEAISAAGGDLIAEDVLAMLAGGSTQQSSSSRAIGLIVLSSEPGAGPSQQRVELAHDTLLRQVPEIAAWIEQHRVLLERQADLEAVSDPWHRIGRPNKGLPSGSVLDHYEWLDVEARKRGRLTPMASERARAFLHVARVRQRRGAYLRRVVVALLAACVALVLVAAWQAWQQQARAQQQQHRAEVSLQSVLLATEQVVSDTDWQLGRLLHTLKVRQALLQHLDDDLTRLPEADKAQLTVSIAIARTKHRRSDLARLNESLSRADAFVAEARRQIDAARERHPASRELLELTALNRSKQAKIALARGDAELSLKKVVESVALLDQLRGDGDNDRRTLATSQAEYAEAALVLGQLPSAAAHADAAIVILAQNDSDYDRSQLALALRLRGLVLRDQGDLAGAANVLERGALLDEPLLKGYPGNVYYLWILASIRAELATIRRRQGRRADAELLVRWAGDVADELHRGDPTHKDYALLLCKVLREAADVADGRGDTNGGVEARRRACTIAARLRATDRDDDRFRYFPCP